MQPEISHRCESCGAAMREQAMFCPECGRALAQQNTPSTSSGVEKAPATVAERSAKAESSAASSSTETAEAAIQNQSPVKADPDPGPAKSEGPAEASHQTAAKPGTYGKARDSLHRAGSAATNVARHALDDNVKRVEKIRHVSSAMIEQSSYDPSLRFVLVALGLFVVFLALLLLSKVMG